MMWDRCASSAVCMKSKSDVRPNDKSSSHVYVRMYVRVLVCVCLLACVRCCISNYGLQKPIMVVLPCCDAQDHSLHRKYFVIDVCVWAATDQNEGLMRHERVCSPCLWCMCVCDTGGAMATNFLPEEVINAPAWLWLCLFLSSNDCHTAIMASKEPRDKGRIMAEANATRLLLNCTDEIHALKSCV